MTIASLTHKKWKRMKSEKGHAEKRRREEKMHMAHGTMFYVIAYFPNTNVTKRWVYFVSIVRVKGRLIVALRMWVENLLASLWCSTDVAPFTISCILNEYEYKKEANVCNTHKHVSCGWLANGQGKKDGYFVDTKRDCLFELEHERTKNHRKSECMQKKISNKERKKMSLIIL